MGTDHPQIVDDLMKLDNVMEAFFTVFRLDMDNLQGVCGASG